MHSFILSNNPYGVSLMTAQDSVTFSSVGALFELTQSLHSHSRLVAMQPDFSSRRLNTEGVETDAQLLGKQPQIAGWVRFSTRVTCVYLGFVPAPGGSGDEEHSGLQVCVL